MELEHLEAGVVRGALLLRIVTLALAKAGYEHAEPLPNDEIQGIVTTSAQCNCLREVVGHD